jgi:iron complex outermembrane receptor protein
VSRAVHTPSRFERQISATLAPISIDPLIYPRVLGNGNIVSEEMIAYEIGYREQMTEKFSWDAALFYNTYGLLVFQTPQWPPVPEPTPWPHDILNLTTSNGQSGEGYGVELSGDYAVREWWRLHASYTYLNLHLRPTAFQVGIDDPPNQISLRSAWDVRENMEFDMTCRYVDRLSNIQVPSYISMDLRLAYRPKKNVEVAVVGQNLLQESHQEFNAYPLTMVTEVPRGVYSTLTWRR